MNEKLPLKAYGVMEQNACESSIDQAVEQLSILGYAIVDSGYSLNELKILSNTFDSTYSSYLDKYGVDKLKEIDEIYTIRALLTNSSDSFLRLAMNQNVIDIVKSSIIGRFILNQQNGIINPVNEKYNQGVWHRDLPYQHFVSSRSIAINALFCLDDFTLENGATYVLPASHKMEAFPSESYIKKNAIQVEAKAGSFILLDCMLYHAGGFNKSLFPRRAVNHIFNIPYFKQQINIPANMADADLTINEKDILGFNSQEPHSILDYLLKRDSK